LATLQLQVSRPSPTLALSTSKGPERPKLPLTFFMQCPSLPIISRSKEHQQLVLWVLQFWSSTEVMIYQSMQCSCPRSLGRGNSNPLLWQNDRRGPTKQMAQCMAKVYTVRSFPQAAVRGICHFLPGVSRKVCGLHNLQNQVVASYPKSLRAHRMICAGADGYLPGLTQRTFHNDLFL